MKKLALIVLLFAGIKSFGQVAKADFETIFTQFPFEKMEKIVVNNVHVYYTDGTNAWSYYSYKTATTSYEIKNDAFYIKSYKDNTKTVLSSYYIIPFDKMTSVSASETLISVQLVE